LKISSVPYGLSEIDLVRFCSEIFPKEPMCERFVNEARFGLSRVLRTVSSFDTGTGEVLEIGAGSCILSAYLASKRLRVTAAQPLGPGFDFFSDLQNRVLAFCRCNSIEMKIIYSTGWQLDLSGRFDLAVTTKPRAP